ncbi:hypothetical protein C8F01DRAFT_1338787 [Mycena amicta]|nr:hypothetical protein C8F01DRAFT_1338787 [Mycena amicta]
MSANSPPKLPPELECAIFQLTASAYPTIIPTLLLVAWRVHAWVEPLLYRTIMFKTVTLESVPSVLAYPLDDFKRMVVTERNPSPFLSVHNCMICVLPADEALAVLAAMPAIQNLFMSVSGKLHTKEQPLPAQFKNLPLRHLYGDLEEFVALKNLDPLDHRCFTNLTHLELFMVPSAWGDDITPWTAESRTSWGFITRLPCLTHIAFDIARSETVLEFLLANCRLLQCLVLLCKKVSTNDYTPAITADPRFVVMQTPSLHDYVLDWKEGTMTGEDYWTQAEVFIEKRRSRKIADSDYFFQYYFLSS